MISDEEKAELHAAIAERFNEFLAGMSPAALAVINRMPFVRELLAKGFGYYHEMREPK